MSSLLIDIYLVRYYLKIPSNGRKSDRRLLQKKDLDVIVNRASIPETLPAIFPISMLGICSVTLFCFLCLSIDTDDTRMIPLTAY